MLFRSDTKYSFAHFGESGKLFIFEAPIDMLSYITLHPENWQKHSYIAMNGVYENAVLTALKGHSNLSEILICTDNDEGGIDAADRLKDILSDSGYADIKRILPHNKDFNEDLKQLNGVEFLPAVPHRRLEKYHETAGGLQYLRCRPERLISQISAAFRNGQYRYLAEYALAGSAFFIGVKDEEAMFEKLKSKLANEYRAYSDKGRISAKIDSLKSAYSAVYRDLKMPAYTREQSVQTAKNLFILADCAVKICTEQKLCQKNDETESETSEMSPGERHEVIRY